MELGGEIERDEGGERWRRSKSAEETGDGPEGKARKARMDGERDQEKARRWRDEMGKPEGGEERREGVNEG